MKEIDPERTKRWKIHGLVGGLVGGLTMLFMYFIALDLGDPVRFAAFTASQHPIELPIYLTLCALGASLVYFALVWVFTRK